MLGEDKVQLAMKRIVMILDGQWTIGENIRGDWTLTESLAESQFEPVILPCTQQLYKNLNQSLDPLVDHTYTTEMSFLCSFQLPGRHD